MVKMTCFRFNLDNPEHAKAWHYLHDFDKDKVKSGNSAVVQAVNEYFDRMQKLEDDPYFENREREERFIEQIVSEVGKVFTAEMPKFLASLLLSWAPRSLGAPSFPRARRLAAVGREDGSLGPQPSPQPPVWKA